MDPILSIHDGCFSYGEAQFELGGVNLEVHSGEMLGIVGPNGSGKSTLLRMMAGILTPSRGEVRIGGRPVTSFRRRELAREVAFLPQGISATFEFTVHEVVAMGRYPYQGPLGLMDQVDDAIVEGALRETDALHMAERYFSTLSGGEKQRVLVASILAQQPQIMLLDEPSAALDIHHASHVFDLLWALSRKGIGVVVVTHDLNHASQFCDTLALLQAGRLREVGPPSDVIREELLIAAYQTPLRVVAHPLTSLPMVLVLGRKSNEGNETPAQRP